MESVDYIHLKLQEYRSFIDRIFAFVLTSTYGTIILFLNFLSFIRHGKKFFFINNRHKLPVQVHDPLLGVSGYVQCNNTNIHFMKKGSNDKEMVLFVHGFPEFWYSWQAYYLEFSKNYFTVAIDLRGFGDSDKLQDAESYTFKNMSEDLRHIIHYFGHTKAIIIANDIGASIAAILAREHPEVVDRLILVNGLNINSFYEFSLLSCKQFIKSWYIYFFQLPFIPEFNITSRDFRFFDNIFEGSDKCTKDLLEAYKYLFSQIGSVTSALNVFRANMFNPGILTNETLGDIISVPTFIIYGSNSRFIDEISVMKVKKNFTSLFVRKVKGGHFVHYERFDYVSDLIKQFLAKDFSNSD